MLAVSGFQIKSGMTMIVPIPMVRSGVTTVLGLMPFVVIPAKAGGVAHGCAVNGPEDGIQYRSDELIALNTVLKLSLRNITK